MGGTEQSVGPSIDEVVRSGNGALYSLEKKLTAELTSPQLPAVFILGTPRCGSTLLSQLLAHWGGFSYVSNFLARFWMAPYVGSMFEQHLGVRDSAEGSAYESAFGATRQLIEPHEFTYFWRRWFDQGQEGQKLNPDQLETVDAAELSRSIAALEHAWNGPVVLKNSFWCNFQVRFLADLLPRALFIWCRRDPLYSAQSIVLARETIVGSRERWWSMKPPGFRALVNAPWWQQVAGQVCFTEREIFDALADVPQERKLTVDYIDTCGNPARTVRMIVDATNKLGADVPRTGTAPEGFKPTDRQRLPQPDFEQLLKAVQEFRTQVGL